MMINQYSSHSVAATLAAIFVTTVLVASLVESFEPAQLFRLEERATGNPIIALDRRADDADTV